MPADMLVKLYELEDDWSFVQKQAAKGITIRKPIGPEKRLLIDVVLRRHVGELLVDGAVGG